MLALPRRYFQKALLLLSPFFINILDFRSNLRGRNSKKDHSRKDTRHVLKEVERREVTGGVLIPATHLEKLGF